MRRADGFEDGWPEDWREDVVPVDPDRDPRFPRCWDLATGAEVTESVWYLNRDRDPPRAVLVGNGGERGIRLAAVRVSSARGGMGRELSAAAVAECAAALRASASRAAAAKAARLRSGHYHPSSGAV